MDCQLIQPYSVTTLPKTYQTTNKKKPINEF